jgi:hypothetical protein
MNPEYKNILQHLFHDHHKAKNKTKTKTKHACIDISIKHKLMYT